MFDSYFGRKDVFAVCVRGLFKIVRSDMTATSIDARNDVRVQTDL